MIKLQQRPPRVRNVVEDQPAGERVRRTSILHQYSTIEVQAGRDGRGVWQAVLADLLDQALTVDAFIGAARQAFGETCTVVPIGEGIAMQQVMPPQRIIITEMISDMITGASCY